MRHTAVVFFEVIYLDKIDIRFAGQQFQRQQQSGFANYSVEHCGVRNFTRLN